MNTIMVPRTEYKKLLQTQKELFNRIDRLEKIVEELEPDIKLSVLRRWGKQSNLIAQGRGKVFKSIEEFKNHLKNL